jgi:3-deoxy-D-arabino-heptulosonate 7-phosphate (DAHP) synthase class II
MKQALNLIENLAAATKKDPEKFSPWERDFVKDQAERAKKWGEEIRLSEKQISILSQIAKKVGIEEEEGV